MDTYIDSALVRDDRRMMMVCVCVCVCVYGSADYLVTSLDLDAETVVESLWFGQYLKSSSECHWDVNLYSVRHQDALNCETKFFLLF